MDSKKNFDINILTLVLTFLLAVGGAILMFVRNAFPKEVSYGEMLPIVVMSSSYFVYLIFSLCFHGSYVSPELAKKSKFYGYGAIATALLALVLVLLCLNKVFGDDVSATLMLIAGLLPGFPLFFVQLFSRFISTFQESKSIKVVALTSAITVFEVAFFLLGTILVFGGNLWGSLFYLALPLTILGEVGSHLE